MPAGLCHNSKDQGYTPLLEAFASSRDPLLQGEGQKIYTVCVCSHTWVLGLFFHKEVVQHNF
jgi:hypothetical protein